MENDRGDVRPEGAAAPTRRIALLLAALAVLLLIPLPRTTRDVAAAFDLMHAPLFAVVAFFIARMWRIRSGRSTAGIAGIVWVMLSGFGLGIELLQVFVERFPSWHDALANALGAGAGVLSSVAIEGRRTATVLVCGSVAALLVAASWHPAATLVDCYRQRRDMPLLASFEDGLELERWGALEASIERSRNYVTHGACSLRVDIPTTTYPGIGSRSLPRDWSRFEELQFDVALAEGPDLSLIVKIYDEAHNLKTEDRFHAVIPLKPGPRRVRIALSDIARAPQGRRMDLTRVRCVEFFAANPRAPGTLFFDNVRLR